MIFVSLSVYALGKELGPDDAVAEVHRQLAECAHSTAVVADDFLPAVRVIARLRLLDELELRIDAGATVIGKARSRAFHAAQLSKADVWISVDDDIDATKQTLEWILEAVARPAPTLCLAPYLLRRAREQTTTLSVSLPLIYTHRNLSNGGRVRSAEHGGFGLVCLNRAAIDAVARHWDNPLSFKSLAFVDDDGEQKLALFHDQLMDRKWWGEDISFFRRLPKDVEVVALSSGVTCHEGLVLDLKTVPGLQEAPF